MLESEKLKEEIEKLVFEKLDGKWPAAYAIPSIRWNQVRQELIAPVSNTKFNCLGLSNFLFCGITILVIQEIRTLATKDDGLADAS